MDWLNKAAEGFKNSLESQKEKQRISEIIKESYPDKVSELWLMFEETFNQIAEKFGSKTGYHAKGNQMQLVVGDVLIKGFASEADITGGYYGRVNISIEYTNSSRSINTHFENLLLGEYNGEPNWVYRDEVNNRMQDVLFKKDDIEKIFKNALSIYL